MTFESARSGLAQEIWVSDPDGSNAVQITRSAPGHANGNPTWSPDGQRILYTDLGVEGTGAPDLFTMSADGTDRRQVTHAAFLEAVATWSHDGRWAYYRQDGPDGRDIFRVSVDSGSKERLTKHGGLYPTVSWDDKTLVFTTTEVTSALFKMPVAGGDEEQIVDCVASRALAVAPPNDLYYVGCSNDSPSAPVHRRNLTTGRDEVIWTIPASPKMLGLAVSPDGKTILYAPFLARGSDLMMLENFR
jgi:Tol biopolymer transport system component